MTTFKASGEWHELDENHKFRFVKAGGSIVGGVLQHRVRGTDEDCEPGLVQWEPYGESRPLFALAGSPGQELSVTPFILCALCGDKGWISKGKWIPKTDDEGVEKIGPMRVLDLEETEDDEELYRTAIRRDLGDKVPEEEEGADRRLYDMAGGPTIITSEKTDGDECETPTIRDIGPFDTPVTHAQQREWEERDREERSPTVAVHFSGGKVVEVRHAEDREVKDSGHRREFETGAQRDRAEGKGRFDLLQVLALPRIAVILEKGVAKYDDRNWERGMPLSTYMDSALRHLTQYIAGKEDEDHLGQAAWNLLAAMQTEEMIDMEILPRALSDLPRYYGRDRVEGGGVWYTDEDRAAQGKAHAVMDQAEGDEHGSR